MRNNQFSCQFPGILKFIAYITVVFSGLPVLAEDCLFKVQSVYFCKSIEDHAPVSIINTNQVRLKHGESLYLWTLIRVSKEGVKMLKASQTLKMTHAWCCNSKLIFEVNHIGISREMWHKASKSWLAQFESNGFFEYRTCSRVCVDLKSGTWKVHIYDVDNHSPIYNDRLCRPTIEAKMVK